jgi:hypothetical protein
MCDVLLAPGVKPTAVRYIYHIIYQEGLGSNRAVVPMMVMMMMMMKDAAA